MKGMLVAFAAFSAFGAEFVTPLEKSPSDGAAAVFEKRFENRGYQITSARIRAMVFWKPDDEYPGEIMIILPELVLTRKDQV